jgi:hypothetical protein
MAQEENEKKKESGKDAQEVTLTGYHGSIG